MERMAGVAFVMSDFAHHVRAPPRAGGEGFLSTLSVRHGGHPFGSVLPYALWKTGEPIFFVSGLAAHTQNLLADARCSLLVSDPPKRATLVGRCAPLPD